MNTYKIGNQVTAIIRSYNSGSIGSILMKYDNQPYTIVTPGQVNIKFADITTNVKSKYTDMYYNNSQVSTVTFSDVGITDKILNLIFSKSEEKLYSVVENYESSDKIIYLHKPADIIYQVFIYDTNQNLVQAYGEYSEDTIAVEEDGNYLVCFQYEGVTAYNFDKTDNRYFKLDLIFKSNENEQLGTTQIHIDKCAVKVNKNMVFNQLANTVDLEFVVIDNHNNYIIVK